MQDDGGRRRNAGTRGNEGENDMAVQQNKKSPSKRGMHRRTRSARRADARASSRSAARRIGATTSARAATTAARRSSRPRPTSDVGRVRLTRPRRAGASTRVAPGNGRRDAAGAAAWPAMSVTIAVDAMGGDHGPAVTVPAVARLPRGDAGRLDRAGRARRGARAAAREVALARARAACASARRPRSSRWTSRRPTRCAARRIRRCASRSTWSRTARRTAACRAGNTGALMGIARFVLKTLPGIDRPAIASQLPTKKGVVTMLDLGANVNCTSRAAGRSSRRWAARWSRRSSTSSARPSASSTSARRTSRATTSSRRRPSA